MDTTISRQQGFYGLLTRIGNAIRERSETIKEERAAELAYLRKREALVEWRNLLRNEIDYTERISARLRSDRVKLKIAESEAEIRLNDELLSIIEQLDWWDEQFSSRWPSEKPIDKDRSWYVRKLREIEESNGREIERVIGACDSIRNGFRSIKAGIK